MTTSSSKQKVNVDATVNVDEAHCACCAHESAHGNEDYSCAVRGEDERTRS